MSMVSKLRSLSVVILLLVSVAGSEAGEFKLESGLYEANPVRTCKTAVVTVQPGDQVITLEGVEEEKCGEGFDVFIMENMRERPNLFRLDGTSKARIEVQGNRKFLMVDFNVSDGTGPERKTWFVWKSPLPPK